MRIISGKYKGRKLKTPDDNSIRPTSDRLRENLFNVLIHSDLGIEDLLIMDIFAGTGAMGLEALSRGAEKCIFVENSMTSIRLIKANIEHLSAKSQSEVIHSDATKLKKAPSIYENAVELVLMDAPFPQALELTRASMESLYEGKWLADNVWVIAKIPEKLIFEAPTPFFITRELKAGASKAIIMQVKDDCLIR
ncbi:MAG: 16S rRNA (guanine(966)-N(2))-methyltransferase RsmD [Alphaproteobacteria bacterium]